MGYFAFISKSAFITAPDGRRLFYSAAHWRRPYIVPDAQTERRLLAKQMWMHRIMFAAMFVIWNPILFAFVLRPGVEFRPLRFFALLVAESAHFWILGHIMFRHELPKLTRAKSQLPMRDRFAGAAAQRSVGELLLMILMSIGFVIAGLFFLTQDFFPFNGPWFAWLTIGLFGFCALSLGWMLVLKLKSL